MKKRIALIEKGEIEQFDPDRHRLKVAALDYGIEEAKRIKDWPKLEEAVDLKIEEQQKFVAWWSGIIRSQGEARKKENRERGFLSVADAEKITGIKQQRVSDLGKKLNHSDKYRLHLLGAGYRAAMLEAVENVRGTQGTGENEWNTPIEFVELARSVLGVIDLDPATHTKAQERIKAAQFFTKQDDGLKHEWHGRVWLNPPYAQPLIGKFVSKMCAERKAGHVTAAVMLTHNYTDTAWFQEAAGVADAICFTRGRIKFYDPESGIVGQPTQGQAFFYFGDAVALFADRFNIGFVVMPWMPK